MDILGEMSIYAHIFVLCFFRESFCYADVCSGAGNWSFYDRQCYSCIADAVSWPTARTSCQQLGADLVTISNAGTQSFLEKRCPYQEHWIGLNDIYNESYFTWVGDSTIILKESYINWRENEPNDRNGEDCVVIDRWYQYKWNDLSCSDNRSYICQKPQLQSVPQAPLNFTGSSYGTNYVNLTWISSFNGGYEQFFILSLSEASNWKVIGNITDPGEGKLAHFDPGYLTPGQEYRFRLKSCNVVNCSVYSAEFELTNKGVPQAPLNFTGSSYGTNYVNLTWISSFNGGYEQFFILSLSEASNWKVIGNITDPGEGKLAHFDPGYLTPGQEYRFRLKSCNVVNCSVYSAEFELTNKDAKVRWSRVSLMFCHAKVRCCRKTFVKSRHGHDAIGGVAAISSKMDN